MRQTQSQSTSPTVEGVGINDADYSVVKSKCPYYAVWQAMVIRCYSTRSLKIFPTYQGCSVTDSWLVFSVFKSWMMQQDWYGKVLDKDIIKPGNKVYGPDACLFVSQAINSLLNRQPKQGGKYPKGVRKYGNSGKFRVDMRKHKKHTHLGVFI